MTLHNESALNEVEKRSKGSSIKSKNEKDPTTSRFFEDPAKIAKFAQDSNEYQSIQYEEIKMLRQKLNAKSNDIKLLESNHSHQIKQIR